MSDLLGPVLFVLVSVLIGVMVEAFALDMVQAIVRGWVRLYSRGLPSAEQEQRRDEILADLHDHVQDALEQKYPPKAIALQVLLRWMFGVEADLAWRWETQRTVERKRLEEHERARGAELPYLYYAELLYKPVMKVPATRSEAIEQLAKSQAELRAALEAARGRAPLELVEL